VVAHVGDEVPMARILLIDDDPMVRSTLEFALKQSGHEVICASDGREGLRAYASATPQLVIVDIIMPNKEGLETIIEIRARDPKTPIIAISGGGRTTNDNFLEMATLVGADKVLRKPFERKDLTAMINRLLPA
jgi:DNA-binding response OmpR family regulator